MVQCSCRKHVSIEITISEGAISLLFLLELNFDNMFLNWAIRRACYQNRGGQGMSRTLPASRKSPISRNPFIAQPFLRTAVALNQAPLQSHNIHSHQDGICEERDQVRQLESTSFAPQLLLILGRQLFQIHATTFIRLYSPD
jgi:hypothetical protein